MSEIDNNSQGKNHKVCKLALASLWIALAGILAMFLFVYHVKPAPTFYAGHILLSFLAMTFAISVLLALLLGVISVIRIQRSKGQLEGRAFAVAGIVLPVVVGLSFITMLPRIRSEAPQLICGTNLKGLGGALIVYASENDDKYPVADKWSDLLIQHCKITPKNFFCSETDAILGESSYAMNRNVSGRRLSELPPDIVVLFDTNFGKDSAGRQELLRNRAWYQSDSAWLTNKYPGTQKVYKSRWNQFGGPEILTTENHKGKGCNILFNDGSVKFIPTDRLDTLKWRVEEHKP